MCRDALHTYSWSITMGICCSRCHLRVSDVLKHGKRYFSLPNTRKLGKSLIVPNNDLDNGDCQICQKSVRVIDKRVIGCWMSQIGDDREESAAPLSRAAILAISIAYSCSISLMYRSNKDDKYQFAFVIAGTAIAVLSGVAMSASGTQIILRYMMWGLLLTLLSSWLVHGILNYMAERNTAWNINRSLWSPPKADCSSGREGDNAEMSPTSL